jgi:hypothetical protein
MRKDQLIAALQSIPGNPVIVLPAPDHEYRLVGRIESTDSVYSRGILSEHYDEIPLEEGERLVDVVVIT